MKQEPLKRRRPAARKRGRKQTLRAVVLSVLTVSVIALCLGIWTRLPGEDVPVGGIASPEDTLSPASSVAAPEPEPEPQPVVETIRFSAAGDNLIHAPIYKQAARRAGEARPARLSAWPTAPVFYQSYHICIQMWMGNFDFADFFPDMRSGCTKCADRAREAPSRRPPSAAPASSRAPWPYG